MDIKETLDLDDEVIEFEITSNRPDCLSMVGIAREAAVTLKTSYTLTDKAYRNIGHTLQKPRW